MSWAYRRVFLEIQEKMESNDLVAADQLLSVLLEKDANLFEAKLHRAYIRLRQSKLSGAYSDASDAVRLRPESGVAAMILGEVLLAQGNVDEAYKTLRLACQLEKDNGRAHYHLAEACILKGLKHEAAEEMELALQFERDYTMAHILVENRSSSLKV